MKMPSHKIVGVEPGEPGYGEECPGAVEDGYAMTLQPHNVLHCNYCGHVTDEPSPNPPPLPERAREYLTNLTDDANQNTDLVREVFSAFLDYQDLFAEMGAEATVADGVYVDKGHVVVHTNDYREGHRAAAFLDLGPVLHLWSGQGASLTPGIARQLGKALVAWADKKNPPPFDLMVTLTGDALAAMKAATDDATGREFGIPEVHTLRLAVDRGTFKIKENEGSWSYPLTDGVLIQEGHEIP